MFFLTCMNSAEKGDWIKFKANCATQYNITVVCWMPFRIGDIVQNTFSTMAICVCPLTGLVHTFAVTVFLIATMITALPEMFHWYAHCHHSEISFLVNMLPVTTAVIALCHCHEYSFCIHVHVTMQCCSSKPKI